MLQSKLFTKTSKQTPKDETSVNASLLMRAGFVDKLTAGVYTYLPLGLRVLNKIKNIIREEMNELGGQEILMPALTPKENWVTTGRWDKIDVMFKLEGAGSKEYALGSTHEEVVTPLVQKFASSYKDLPVAVYQIQDKFRNEPRAKAGLLRGREFSMKDLYSFHGSDEDLDRFYEKSIDSYFKIFKRCSLESYLTFASGGVFSKYSHEFQTLTENGEDHIFVCEKCKVAVNKEIIEEQKECPKCGNKDLVEKKSIEIGNIFKLKSKFTDAFGYKYTDEEGKQQPVVMGCYGIGPSRIMGTIVEIYNDENGMVWPKEVAPFDVHLLSLGEDEKILKETEKIYKKLQAEGVEVLWDDRNITAGNKFADSDLIGIPKRVVVSKKTLEAGSVEVKMRNEKESNLIEIKNL